MYVCMCVYLLLRYQKHIYCVCVGVPFTNRGCLKLTLGYNDDCEITVSKGMHVHVHVMHIMY